MRTNKKQKVYHKAKRTNSNVDWDAYRTLNDQFTYAKKPAFNSKWKAKLAKNDNEFRLFNKPNVPNLTSYLL